MMFFDPEVPHEQLPGHVFVTGWSRTGTHLMNAMLDGGEDCFCFPTHSALPSLLNELNFKEFCSITKSHNLENLYYLLLTSGVSRFLKSVEQGDLAAEFDRKSSREEVEYVFSFSEREFKRALDEKLLGRSWTFGNIVEAFRQAYLLGLGMGSGASSTPRWTVMTKTYVGVDAPILKRWHDNSKFIFLVRDPRAVFASRKKSRLDDQTKTYDLKLISDFLLTGYRRYYELLAQVEAELGEGAVKFVRYEDLVLAPEEDNEGGVRVLRL